MSLGRLILRNLVYYWRTNLAVIAGIAIAVSVLSGALLVGQSVRSSLRGLLYQRLGVTEYLITADRFFRADLASAFTTDASENGSATSCPVIYLQGVAVHEATGMRAFNVNIYGIDERFWRFQGMSGQKTPEGREAIAGAPLARKLGMKTGDSLLLRIEAQQGIPKESLYGKRENAGRTVRVNCTQILPPENLGEFALRPSQGEVYSIFVPLQRLQKDLAQPGLANVILLTHGPSSKDVQEIRRTLKEKFTLEDVGVQLHPLPAPGGMSIESSRVLLEDSIAQAASRVQVGPATKISGIFSYLANSIRSGDHEIPYSVITAADLERGALTAVRMIEQSGTQSPADRDESIWLTDWSWHDLQQPALGNPIEIDYFQWQEEGRLATRTAHFRLAGVVGIGGDVDAALTPHFPGITEARDMRSWDPPFPLDLGKIRPQDEAYWNRFKATPKAFIKLASGQKLWQSRFGKLSSVRIAFPPGADPRTTQEGISRQLRNALDPEAVGFVVSDVRRQGVDSAQGSTNFGEYFIYFSFFLVVAAILFSSLFFRLGIEQRVREIGTLQAAGFPMSTLQTIFLVEGFILSTAGSLLGVLGAIGYGSLLVLGLRTWWVGAVGTSRIYLNVSPAELCAGAGTGILVSLVIIGWTLMSLRRNSPRALLAGVLESNSIQSRRTRVYGVAAGTSFLAALALLIGAGSAKISPVEAFFGSGFFLLLSMLSGIGFYLRRVRSRLIAGNGWSAFLRLAVRNTMYRPARSLLCITLIASATFILVSVEAFRQDPKSISLDPTSGTGGYPLLAESALPIVYDANDPAGREALGLPETESAVLSRVRFVPFRLRPGDDASCLNLYAILEPRILGASPAFIAGGRFSFQDSLAATPDQRRNPWRLLDSTSQDGTLPAIGDANTIEYILHLGLGSELTIRGSSGAPVRLRIVGALRDSVLQGELLISETNFLHAFPDREGFRFFLIDAPPSDAAAVGPLLTRHLSDFGLNVESSLARLAAYHRVENTYLSTFQSLGALGLILGTAGLATVLLRNALERRHELALLRAVGYRKQVLSAIIVAENAILMVGGLACGTLCAALAVVPALHTRGMQFPVLPALIILSAVFAVGLTSSLLAVIAVFRAPLLSALRSE